MRSRTEWVIVDADGEGQVGRCTRCGGILRLKLPIDLKAAVLYMKAFVEEHRHCKDGGEAEATGGSSPSSLKKRS